MREIWRPVVGFKGSYEVSNLGRVRSIDRIVISHRREGLVKRKFKGKMLKPGPCRSGHLTVCLQRGKSRLVHHLVLEAFVGPRPRGQEGRHLDDTPKNNVLSNLCWGTRSQNLHDAVRNGKKAISVANWNAKLTKKAVRYIRKNAPTETVASMSRKFRVSAGAVNQVINGVTWRHVI